MRTRPSPNLGTTATRPPSGSACECCRDDCTDVIAVTPDELDALVDLDRGHLLVPGHEDLASSGSSSATRGTS